jgi:hypothetical protein
MCVCGGARNLLICMATSSLRNKDNGVTHVCRAMIHVINLSIADWVSNGDSGICSLLLVQCPVHLRKQHQRDQHITFALARHLIGKRKCDFGVIYNYGMRRKSKRTGSYEGHHDISTGR